MSSTASLLPDSSTQASTPPRRTLEDVRDQVAFELAIRAISTAETLDGVRFGVILTLPKSDDESFLQRIAAVLGHNLLLSPHLFALASPAHLLLTGSPPAHVQRALLLATAALPARIRASRTAPDGSSFAAEVCDITPADEPVLWRALRQSLARDERVPPPGAKSTAQMLADARRGVRRLTPREAFDAVQGKSDDALGGGPTFLVDIRAAPRRGGITGSLIIDRNDLEWAFDPRLAHAPLFSGSTASSSSSAAPAPTPPAPPAAPVDAAPESELEVALRAEQEYEALHPRPPLLIASSYALRPILICADGRASSLAAASLHALGLYNATDVVGGFRAWRAAGLDVADGGEEDGDSLGEY